MVNLKLEADVQECCYCCELDQYFVDKYNLVGNERIIRFWRDPSKFDSGYAWQIMVTVAKTAMMATMVFMLAILYDIR
jgi:hypothetical protein